MKYKIFDNNLKIDNTILYDVNPLIIDLIYYLTDDNKKLKQELLHNRKIINSLSNKIEFRNLDISNLKYIINFSLNELTYVKDKINTLLNDNKLS